MKKITLLLLLLLVSFNLFSQSLSFVNTNTTYQNSNTLPNFEFNYVTTIPVDIYIEVKLDDGTGNPTGDFLGGIILNNQPVSDGSTNRITTLDNLDLTTGVDYLFTGAFCNAGSDFEGKVSALNIPFTVIPENSAVIKAIGGPNYGSSNSYPISIEYVSDVSVDMYIEVYKNDGTDNPTGVILGSIDPYINQTTTITPILLDSNMININDGQNLPAGDYVFVGASFSTGGGFTNKISSPNVPFTVDPALSISEFTNKDISSIVTSQNPVSTTINLNANGDYSISNIAGQTVQAGTFDSSVNVESLSTGIYFLAIENGTYKFAKN